MASSRASPRPVRRYRSTSGSGPRGRVRRATAALALVGALACGAEGPTDPAPSPEVARLRDFESLWTDFDSTYPFFPLKDVDWDSVRTATRPAVEAAETDRAFFDLLAEVLLALEDAHVRLTARFGTVTYRGWFEPFPHNFDFGVVAGTHLVDGPHLAPDGTMRYGRLGGEIGYVHIPSFGDGGHEADVEAVLAALEGIRALVVDVRDNGGGSDLNSRRVAGRFADRARLFRRIRVRDGPEHDDYTEPEDDVLEPAGTRFDQPVALLTNRRVASAAEDFVLAMRVLPTVTVVGDTTGGASANPALRTLSNGWTYTVSRWLVTTPEDEVFEGVGLAPDHPVWISDEDRDRRRDTILESAVAVLESALTARSRPTSPWPRPSSAGADRDGSPAPAPPGRRR